MSSRIFVTGATGFVAQALIPRLIAGGARVYALLYKHEPDFQFETSQLAFVKSVADLYQLLQQEGHQSLDAVIHLAGAGIGDRLWTAQRKQVLQTSRWDLIESLHAGLLEHEIAVSIIIGASAIGYYGQGGETPLNEQAAMGRGFSAELCAGVELHLAKAAQSANAVWHGLRIGVVLGANGGLLQRLELPAKLGLGSTIGDGSTWLSWIDRHDLVRAIEFLLIAKLPAGPINLTAPTPVRWHEFAQALAGVFGKKSRIKIPGWCLAPLGEMKCLFLDSVRANPKVLLDAGFKFERAELKLALKAIYS